jgi:glycosyltransferase involved in cell wall biosynthesis
MDIGFAQTRGKTPRLLIISFDIVGKQMAGPGIRFYEFARILSEYVDVTLATPNRIDISTNGFKTFVFDLNNYKLLKKVSEHTDMILIQGHILHYFPFLKNFKGKIIVDLYNPFNLESLEMFKNDNLEERLRIDKNNVDLLKFQLSIGDFFICASEKQRSYWLGMLNAMGRVNPFNYDKDDTFKKLIDVVPFGIPSSQPRHTGESVKKAFPGVKEDDNILLWGGGIWNWLDPITAVKALWEISRNRSDIKLIFVGVKHPDPKLPQMQKAVDAIKLCQELDLYNKFIFFNDWVPYELRQNFLLESSAGLSLHHEKIETEFAFRTRVMDYIWAKLPIITTEGDSIAKIVKSENIGEIVKYENTSQLSRVIESMVSNRSLRDIYTRNLEKISASFHWENVTKPLIEYCTDPEYSRDKKMIFDFIGMQNNKIVDVIKKNFSGATNILVVSSNVISDKELFRENVLGKLYFVETEEVTENAAQEESKADVIGVLKSKILSRTKFDGAIINNSFKNITPKFFYDLVNVIGMKLKSEGTIFFSVPENRGVLKVLNSDRDGGYGTDERIDEFTFEYILKNTGYEIIEKGIWDKIEFLKDTGFEKKVKNISTLPVQGENYSEMLYSKNELMDLFEIKLSDKDFRELSLLKGLNILDSEELAGDRTLRGKIKKYIYAVTGLYLENLRKSYNTSMQAINNNIHLQINREINELNAKNRERLIFIYYNIFRTLMYEVSNLQVDLRAIRKIVEDQSGNPDKEKTLLDEKLEVLLGDIENIDRIMGLTISNKYFVARKL